MKPAPCSRQLGGIATAVAILGCASAANRTTIDYGVTAAEAVEDFAHGARTHDEVRMGGAVRILLYPDSFPHPVVRGVLDGISELARLDPDLDVRVIAITWLAAPGMRGGASTAMSGEVVRRLERVARATSDDRIRSHAAKMLGGQQDSLAAAAALEPIARLPASPAEAFPPAYYAVEALVSLGEPGRAVLERLRTTHSVTHLGTRMYLERLAARSYRPL